MPLSAFPPLFAAAEEMVQNTSYALAIASGLAAVREVVGWLKNRDDKQFDQEKALQGQRIEDLEAKYEESATDRAELRERLEKSEAEHEECQRDNYGLQIRLTRLEQDQASSLAREEHRHPGEGKTPGRMPRVPGPKPKPGSGPHVAVPPDAPPPPANQPPA